MTTRRGQLTDAVARMLNRYGEAERQFARYPLASPEGRRAGRAVRRRAAAVERLAQALTIAPRGRGDHTPAWCTRPTHEGPYQQLHASDPVEIITGHDRIVVQLTADNGRPPVVSLEYWYERTDPTDEPASADPDGVLVLKLAAGAELSGVLASLVAAGLGGAR